MKIRYTRKTSGYVSLLLGLITLKVFLEALWLGRGPVPGLSFLFYTLVFYVHYAEKQITRYSLMYYDSLKEKLVIYSRQKMLIIDFNEVNEILLTSK